MMNSVKQAMSKTSELLDVIASGKTVTLSEPCDCGSQIRHNNGGNYHEVVSYKLLNGQLFAQYDDTCELTEPEYWRKVDADVITAEIEVMLVNGWDVE